MNIVDFLDMLLALILKLFYQLFDFLLVFFNSVLHLSFQITRFTKLILEPLIKHFPLLEFEIQIFYFPLVFVRNVVSLLLQGLHSAMVGATLLRLLHQLALRNFVVLFEFAGLFYRQLQSFALLLKDAV